MVVAVVSLLLCDPHAAVQPGAAPAARSAGASPQGVILVYDIANRWSFDGIHRWIKEIDEVCLGAQRSLPVGARVSGWGRRVWPGTRLQPREGVSPPSTGATLIRDPASSGVRPCTWSGGFTGSDRAAACWHPDQPTAPGDMECGDHTHCLSFLLLL